MRELEASHRSSASAANEASPSPRGLWIQHRLADSSSSLRLRHLTDPRRLEPIAFSASPDSSPPPLLRPAGSYYRRLGLILSTSPRRLCCSASRWSSSSSSSVLLELLVLAGPPSIGAAGSSSPKSKLPVHLRRILASAPFAGDHPPYLAGLVVVAGHLHHQLLSGLAILPVLLSPQAIFFTGLGASCSAPCCHFGQPCSRALCSRLYRCSLCCSTCSCSFSFCWA